MPNKLQKTLHYYLTKIKRHPHPPRNLRKILSGCKHPRTPSFAIEGTRNNITRSASCDAVNDHKNDAATLADVDRFLFENFKSLYFRDDDNDKSDNDEEIPKLSSLLFDSSPRFTETPPPGSTRRFFVKPGNSGSLVEDSVSTLTNMTNTSDDGGSGSSNSSPSSTSSSPSKEVNNLVMMMKKNNINDRDLRRNSTLPDNCVALLSYSPTPYDDFRRSMQDVVESRYGGDLFNLHQRIIDWDFMEELLFSYLSLNDKKSRKYILNAFVDLVTVMRRNLEEAAPAKPCSVRTVRINGSRELRKKMTKQLTIEYGSS